MKLKIKSEINHTKGLKLKIRRRRRHANVTEASSAAVTSPRWKEVRQHLSRISRSMTGIIMRLSQSSIY